MKMTEKTKIMNKVERAKQWRLDNRDRYNATKRKWASENKEKHKNSNYKSRQRRRLKCLTHYSGDKLKCACCSEYHIEFLTIDHDKIKPDKKYRSGDNLYGWLIKNNFLEGYHILCLNCNHYIGHYGWCPHEQERES